MTAHERGQALIRALSGHVRREVESQGVSPVELAKRAGLNPRSVTAVIQGTAPVGMVMLIADSLGVVIEARTMTQAERLLGVLQESSGVMTTSNLKVQLARRGVAGNSVPVLLSRLKKDGLVRSPERGKWELAP